VTCRPLEPCDSPTRQPGKRSRLAGPNPFGREAVKVGSASKTNQLQAHEQPATKTQPQVEVDPGKVIKWTAVSKTWSGELLKASGIFETNGGLLWKTTVLGDQIANPLVSSISCERRTHNCQVVDTSYEFNGLNSDVHNMEISAWSDEMIVAHSVGSLCRIGNELVIDIANRAITMRIYPTEAVTEPCKIYSKPTVYSLQPGGYQLSEPVGKSIRERPVAF
jgi:hypothetical protein